MGIPIEYGIYFSLISLLLMILILTLLFNEPNFNKSIMAIILSFFNLIFSIIATYSFMVVDIYGFDYTGTLVSNPVADFYPFGLIFMLFAIFSVLTILYALYLLYQKPWEAVIKKKLPWYME